MKESIFISLILLAITAHAPSSSGLCGAFETSPELSMWTITCL